MTLDMMVGRGLQVAGRLYEWWGCLTDNDLQRQRGYQLLVIGRLRVLGGEAAGLLRYCTPRQALAAQPGSRAGARRVS